MSFERKREAAQACAIYAAVGLLSIALAWCVPAHQLGLAGIVYAVLGPLHGWLMGKRRPAFQVS